MHGFATKSSDFRKRETCQKLEGLWELCGTKYCSSWLIWFYFACLVLVHTMSVFWGANNPLRPNHSDKRKSRWLARHHRILEAESSKTRRRLAILRYDVYNWWSFIYFYILLYSSTFITLGTLMLSRNAMDNANPAVLPSGSKWVHYTAGLLCQAPWQ